MNTIDDAKLTFVASIRVLLDVTVQVAPALVFRSIFTDKPPDLTEHPDYALAHAEMTKARKMLIELGATEDEINAIERRWVPSRHHTELPGAKHRRLGRSQDRVLVRHLP